MIYQVLQVTFIPYTSHGHAKFSQEIVHFSDLTHCGGEHLSPLSLCGTFTSQVSSSPGSSQLFKCSKLGEAYVKARFHPSDGRTDHCTVKRQSFLLVNNGQLPSYLPSNQLGPDTNNMFVNSAEVHSTCIYVF